MKVDHVSLTLPVRDGVPAANYPGGAAARGGDRLRSAWPPGPAVFQQAAPRGATGSGVLGMLVGLVALAVAALFAGAALYINVVEQPARLKLDDRALLAQWQPAYKRGFAMQASLAVLGSLCGAAAWWQTGRPAFLVVGLVLLSNWPYTLFGIMPTNRALMATDPANA